MRLLGHRINKERLMGRVLKAKYFGRSKRPSRTWKEGVRAVVEEKENKWTEITGTRLH